ncbi:unannotated protein [freshwater metagenome]|uniref:Unannotated protein n=1 Tax=freshwater metagenome TaxID=449393 RepID=A0A6J7JJZ6_9ZZZZ|nr:GNAT family N-acetyltransferase [Actinomycetota bacterium]
MSSDGLIIRRALPADRPEIIALLAASLEREADPRFEELYSWKHEENAFGASASWVACDGETIAGFRALMRWEFTRGDELLRCVRAVDTATHPDYQGQGIFTRLTLRGIAELRDEGCGFVFNTPNEQSRPGYLKMGWRVVGQPQVFFRPRSATAALKMLRSRTPAERWSSPSNLGAPAAEILSDARGLQALLDSLPRVAALRTRHTAETLEWRFGSELLSYRIVTVGGGVEDGIAVVRVRQRGDAREAALCEVIAPDDNAKARKALVKTVTKQVDADYVLSLGVNRDGLLPLPRQGPILTWRGVTETEIPALNRWVLTLGDIELF